MHFPQYSVRSCNFTVNFDTNEAPLGHFHPLAPLEIKKKIFCSRKSKSLAIATHFWISFANLTHWHCVNNLYRHRKIKCTFMDLGKLTIFRMQHFWGWNLFVILIVSCFFFSFEILARRESLFLTIFLPGARTKSP